MDIGAIHSVTTVPAIQPIRGDERAAGGFKEMLIGLVQSADEATTRSDELAESLARGEPTDIHTVMTAMTEADLSFRMLLEVRNKLIDAYREIQRIPV